MKLFSLLVLITGINMISVHRGKTHCNKWCHEVRTTREAMWVAHEDYSFTANVTERDDLFAVYLAKDRKYDVALIKTRDCSCRYN